MGNLHLLIDAAILVKKASDLDDIMNQARDGQFSNGEQSAPEETSDLNNKWLNAGAGLAAYKYRKPLMNAPRNYYNSLTGAQTPAANPTTAPTSAPAANPAPTPTSTTGVAPTTPPAFDQAGFQSRADQLAATRNAAQKNMLSTAGEPTSAQMEAYRDAAGEYEAHINSHPSMQNGAPGGTSQPAGVPAETTLPNTAPVEAPAPVANTAETVTSSAGKAVAPAEDSAGFFSASMPTISKMMRPVGSAIAKSMPTFTAAMGTAGEALSPAAKVMAPIARVGGNLVGKVAAPLQVALMGKEVYDIYNHPEQVQQTMDEQSQRGLLGRAWNGLSDPIHNIAAAGKGAYDLATQNTGATGFANNSPEQRQQQIAAATQRAAAQKAAQPSPSAVPIQTPQPSTTAAPTQPTVQTATTPAPTQSSAVPIQTPQVAGLPGGGQQATLAGSTTPPLQPTNQPTPQPAASGSNPNNEHISFGAGSIENHNPQQPAQQAPQAPQPASSAVPIQSPQAPQPASSAVPIQTPQATQASSPTSLRPASLPGTSSPAWQHPTSSVPPLKPGQQYTRLKGNGPYSGTGTVIDDGIRHPGTGITQAATGNGYVDTHTQQHQNDIMQHYGTKNSVGDLQVAPSVTYSKPATATSGAIVDEHGDRTKEFRTPTSSATPIHPATTAAMGAPKAPALPTKAPTAHIG